MRAIDVGQARQIADLIVEGNLSIDAYALEKDFHEINRLAPGTFQNLDAISSLMKGAVVKDASDFANQHREFAVAPVSESKWTLSMGSASPEVEARYQRFLDVMVYGEHKSDFKTAMSVFEHRLLEACGPHSLLSFENSP